MKEEFVGKVMSLTKDPGRLTLEHGRAGNPMLDPLEVWQLMFGIQVPRPPMLDYWRACNAMQGMQEDGLAMLGV